MTSSATILIADDHPLTVLGLSSIIAEHTNYEILATAKNGLEVLSLLHTKLPDLILMDINMPEMDGLKTLKQVKANYPSVKVIIVTLHEEVGIIKKIMDEKADGYLPKVSDTSVYLDTIEKVLNNENVFADFKKQNSDIPNSNITSKYLLTEREVEVLKAIRELKSTKNIASEMNLSEFTIHTHRKNISKKLGLHSPQALVKFAIENGI